jgi:hypothetical protein
MNRPLQRRADRVIWAGTVLYLLAASHELFAAVPPAPTPAPAPAAAAAAPAAPATPAQHFQKECGDCHLAYPARLLPAASWRAMMGSLERHFGVDASLDERTAQAIGQYLVQNAGPEQRFGPAPRRPGTVPAGATPAGAAPAAAAAPLLRISDAPWFVREHREVTPAILAMKEVGSISNCAACHTDATQGRFSESALRMPGGARNGRGFGEEHERGREKEHDRD